MAKLRKELRAKAEDKLGEMLHFIEREAERLTKGTSLDYSLVLRIAATERNKTLADKAITALANDMEADLLRLYNNQQDLALDGVTELKKAKQ